MSIREAAERMGFTFSKLQKMEMGVRFRVPTLDLLANIADVYGRPHAEVMAEAGISVIMPPDVYGGQNRDHSFAALLLHPRLRPMEMDQRWCDSFSSLQKAQIIEFALRVEDLVHAGGPSLTDIITGPLKDEGDEG